MWVLCEVELIGAFGMHFVIENGSSSSLKQILEETEWNWAEVQISVSLSISVRP